MDEFVCEIDQMEFFHKYNYFDDKRKAHLL